MVRGADAARDPVTTSAAVRTESEPGTEGERARQDGGAVMRPFLIGTAVGGVAGAVAGTFLSQPTRRLLVGLIRVASRRLTDAEREELRFELLLQ